MGKLEADPLTLGQLMIEDTSLDKKIARLRDSARTIAWTFARAARLLNAEPEKFFFVGDPHVDDFAGEKPIERGDLDIASLRALCSRSCAWRSSTKEIARTTGRAGARS